MNDNNRQKGSLCYLAQWRAIMRVLRNVLFFWLAMFANISLAAEVGPVAFTQCFVSRPNASEVKQGNCYDYREVSSSVAGERVYAAYFEGRTREVFRMILDGDGNYLRNEGGRPTWSARPVQTRVWANPKAGEKRTMNYVRVIPSGQEFPVRVESEVLRVGTEKVGGVDVSVAHFKVTEYVTDPTSQRGILTRRLELMYCSELRLVCGANSPYFEGYADGIYWRTLNPALIGGVQEPKQERLAEVR